MAAEQAWFDTFKTATILKITEAEVRQKIVNGDFIIQDNSAMPKISFSSDPKRTPQYIYVSPGCTVAHPMRSSKH